MAHTTEPYEELPYESRAILWTAPERLDVASLLHGGPRPRATGYRYLELGCGTGANLRALAYYRPGGEFVGLDGAASHVAQARADVEQLEIPNLRYVHADFSEAAKHLAGESFDFIVAHGVFSWVPPQAAAELLGVMAQHLRPGGIAYVGYNARPGWNVRGMVREHLLRQTADLGGVRTRSERAREIAAAFEQTLARSESPYSQLMAREFRLVAEMNVAYVAHEYLAPENHAYWRSEFSALAAAAGLDIVADADFNTVGGRLPEGLETWLLENDLAGPSVDDTADLLCYRQHHCPVMTHRPLVRREVTADELGQLFIASRLEPQPKRVSYEEGDRFLHDQGGEITVFGDALADLLRRLQPAYPRGQRLAELVDDVAALVGDLKLLAKQGVIELRRIEPSDPATGGRLNALQQLELRSGNAVTSAYHKRHAVS